MTQHTLRSTFPDQVWSCKTWHLHLSHHLPAHSRGGVLGSSLHAWPSIRWRSGWQPFQPPGEWSLRGPAWKVMSCVMSTPLTKNQEAIINALTPLVMGPFSVPSVWRVLPVSTVSFHGTRSLRLLTGFPPLTWLHSSLTPSVKIRGEFGGGHLLCILTWDI